MAFCQFIECEQGFRLLKGYQYDFYKHVRCGILHQAETTGGLRIRRDKGGQLFDAKTKTLNANALITALEESLHDYCERLKTAPWESPIWQNATAKLDAIAAQCST